MNFEGSDPYLWLEGVEAPAALEWVRERNAETAAAYPDIAPLEAELREVYDAKDRIPYPTWRGAYLYNFWQDAANPRGLWRRTTVDGYRHAEPDWEVLLDLDALAEAEGENWVWSGATLLRPDVDRALVSLSRGGADAVVVREFDLVARAFVPDGFSLDEAKSGVSWVDRDTVFVGTDLGPGSTTTSGYPRVGKRWRRGTPLAGAPTAFEGRTEDVAVYVTHDPTPGYERDFGTRLIGMFSSEKYVIPAGAGDAAAEPLRVGVPDDASWDVKREWLAVRPREPWLGHPSGALLVARFDDVIAGTAEWEALFTPDDRTALVDTSWTRDGLLLTVLDDGRARVELLRPAGGGWKREPFDAPGEHVEVAATEPDESADVLLTASGYLTPDTLLRASTAPGGAPRFEVLKREPAFFSTDGLTTRRFFATSADGTRIPYTVVGDERAVAPPTLMTAYGGFEIPLTPGYDGATGRGWLARGGTYVVANIRGGGEYGPRWHRAALRENRTRAFEDCAAVAADLVARGVTTTARLGFRGGSNGGLLAGVMLTRYPDLFGAIVAQVPLFDMLRFHRLLAGASWMSEYGNPDVEGDRAFLGAYSPYHHVDGDRPYPPVLVATSTRDDRVHPAHARKMVARLRETGHDVTYYENVEGGHGAAADNAQRAHLWALIFTFLREKLER